LSSSLLLLRKRHRDTTDSFKHGGTQRDTGGSRQSGSISLGSILQQLNESDSDSKLLHIQRVGGWLIRKSPHILQGFNGELAPRQKRHTLGTTDAARTLRIGGSEKTLIICL
jgi:hypothetical protein